MAFTSAQKMKIVRYLGYPANTLNSDSLSYSKIISDRMLNVLPDGETEVISILTRLAALDTSLSSAADQSGVKKIDDIEFFGSEDGSKLQELRKERKRLVKELGQLLDICPVSSSSMGNVIA